MSDIILDNFRDLAEVVALQNFDKKVQELSDERPQQNRTYSKSGYKKAVKVGDGFKKAVLISKAPSKKVRKGKRFTEPKPNHHGRIIHATNAKNSFKRAQKLKSRKGKKK